ncbi:MAG: sugar ABC transporter permease [Clostridiales bacterium]|jgi:multiple sugar transport system permease protein|nr:sugar ABC transporter permease [Clostridiales bacterium]
MRASTGQTNAKTAGGFFKKSMAGWLFTSPMTLGLLLFTFYPMVMSLVYAFSNFNGVEQFDFVGFRNFTDVFSDRDFYTVLKNTFLHAAISVPLNLVLSYLLALLVNQRIKGIASFRVFYYLPVVIPGIVSGVLWKDIYNPEFGILNQMLQNLGLPPGKFLEASGTAMASLIVLNLWTLGASMALWLSALKNIPEALYESAKIDGITPVKRLFFITVPMSTTMIFYNLITGIIGALQTNSTLVIANSKGRGPDNSLYFYAVKIYHEAFDGTRFNYGYASALAWILFLIIALLTVTVFKTNKWVYYGEDG